MEDHNRRDCKAREAARAVLAVLRPLANSHEELVRICTDFANSNTSKKVSYTTVGDFLRKLSLGFPPVDVTHLSKRAKQAEKSARGILGLIQLTGTRSPDAVCLQLADTYYGSRMVSFKMVSDRLLEEVCIPEATAWGRRTEYKRVYAHM